MSHGRVIVENVHGRVSLTTVEFRYPIRFMSPRQCVAHLQQLYALSFGGGLVSGDHVVIDVELLENTVLELLTQSATKVFKIRPDGIQDGIYGSSNGNVTMNNPLTTSTALSTTTSQTMNVIIHSNSIFNLLPEQVICFRNAHYIQSQEFYLTDPQTSGLVCLDWYTSGRKTFGDEHWVFKEYFSKNNVYVGSKENPILVYKDATKLENSPTTLLADKLGDYIAFATLIIMGPGKLKGMMEDVLGKYANMVVNDPFQTKHGNKERDLTRVYPNLIWTASPVYLNKYGGAGDNSNRTYNSDNELEPFGVVVRIGSKETEELRKFIVKELLAMYEEVALLKGTSCFGRI